MMKYQEYKNKMAKQSSQSLLKRWQRDIEEKLIIQKSSKLKKYKYKIGEIVVYNFWIVVFSRLSVFVQ